MVTEQANGPISFDGTFTITFDSRTNQPECGMCIVNTQYVGGLDSHSGRDVVVRLIPRVRATPVPWARCNTNCATAC